MGLVRCHSKVVGLWVFLVFDANGVFVLLIFFTGEVRNVRKHPQRHKSKVYMKMAAAMYPTTARGTRLRSRR